MTSDARDGSTRLPIDEEIDAAVDAADADLLPVEDQTRLLMGLGRSLLRVATEQARLAHELSIYAGEIDRKGEPLRKRQRFLEDQLDHIALANRSRGQGFTDITGVGRWSTKAGSEGWDIPTAKAARDAIIAHFKGDADAYEVMVENVPTLNMTALREWLDVLRAHHPDDWAAVAPPGVDFRKGDPTVSHTFDVAP